MISFSFLPAVFSVEQFTRALSLTDSAAGRVMDCETGKKSAMAAGADLGAVIGLDAGAFVVQGILNPLICACKLMISNVLAGGHTTQHTKAAGFWGNSARPSGCFQTGGEGVARAALVRSSISIGAVKIYWHCLVSRTVARVGGVGLISWGSCRCPIKKEGAAGRAAGRVVTAGETAIFNNNTHTRP